MNFKRNVRQIGTNIRIRIRIHIPNTDPDPVLVPNDYGYRSRWGKTLIRILNKQVRNKKY